ncbi:pro-resilin-like [Ischnura elegans]|uniref:pro-resilin-like n=1 Tax=Ischnura elegans TaxID=197161 RepID=UPI001ED884D5|nr:pro-resilin-like [Ischnura elegans]
MRSFFITLSTLVVALAAPEPPSGGINGYLPPHGDSGHSGHSNNGITGAIASPFGEPNNVGFGGQTSNSYGHPNGFDGPGFAHGTHSFGHNGHTDGAHSGNFGDRRPPPGSHGAHSGFTHHLSSSFSATTGHHRGIHPSTDGGHNFNDFTGPASSHFGQGSSHGSGFGSYSAHSKHRNEHLGGTIHNSLGGNGFIGNGHTSGAHGPTNGHSGNGGGPSSAYGTPHNNNGFGAISGSRPFSAHGAPHSQGSNSAHLSSTLGQLHGNGFDGNGHHFNHQGAAGGSYVERPSVAYGLPNSNNGGYNTAALGHHGGAKGLAGGYDGYGGGNDISHPASYSFHYAVNDGEGTEFGHQESREGHEAQGEYRVLLPDGRRQIVSYTADQQGYQPEIRYEDTGTGGYNRVVNGGLHGSQNGHNGY